MWPVIAKDNLEIGLLKHLHKTVFAIDCMLDGIIHHWKIPGNNWTGSRI